MLKPSEAKTWIYGFTACHPPIPPKKKLKSSSLRPTKTRKTRHPCSEYIAPHNMKLPRFVWAPVTVPDSGDFFAGVCWPQILQGCWYMTNVSFLHAENILGRCLWNEFFISHVEDQESQDIQILPFLDDRKSIRSNSCTSRRFFLVPKSSTHVTFANYLLNTLKSLKSPIKLSLDVTLSTSKTSSESVLQCPRNTTLKIQTLLSRVDFGKLRGSRWLPSDLCCEFFSPRTLPCQIWLQQSLVPKSSDLWILILEFPKHLWGFFPWGFG